jgi:hypothetical protein
VDEKHYAQDQASEGEGVVVAGVDNLSEHVCLLMESAAKSYRGAECLGITIVVITDDFG